MVVVVVVVVAVRGGCSGPVVVVVAFVLSACLLLRVGRTRLDTLERERSMLARYAIKRESGKSGSVNPIGGYLYIGCSRKGCESSQRQEQEVSCVKKIFFKYKRERIVNKKKSSCSIEKITRKDTSKESATLCCGQSSFV